MVGNPIGRVRRVAGAVFLLACGLAGPAAAQNTLPTGGHVVAGSASIGAPTGNTLTVNQSSNRAVVNWKSFSIGQPNAVDFNQPDRSAAILNRVTGGTASAIAGQINANGQVYLVNPNGIAITSSGSVQVGGGFVASTLGIINGNFMSGNLAFTGNGASAGVSNAGKVTAGPGGYVGLIGGAAANSGVISVPLGKVALGSGEEATFDLNGDGFMQVAVPTGTTTAKGHALVSNSGRIAAAGGTVEMRAATVAGAIRDAVNMSGVIAANSISGHDGAITLGGGPGGAVSVSGTLDASAPPAATSFGAAMPTGNGGRITVAGARVRVGHHAVIGASGAKGGSVLIGVTGPGGQNEARQTKIASGAQILAEGNNAVADSGGYIETSGGTLKLGKATISAGRGGSWLTDPDNLIIDSTAATTIDNALAAGTNITAQTTASTPSGVGNYVTGGTGDIDVVSALSWDTSATLTLSAYNNITVSAPITVSGGGTLVMTYNNASANPNAALTFVMGQGSTQFTSEGSNPALFINNGSPGSGNGTQYTLVYTPTELANINTHTSGGNVVGNYAIAANIDLGGASHGGPVIGNDAANFNGTLEGLGNTISNVTINSGNFEVGFISVINGAVRNLALGVDVTSTNTTGATTGGLTAFNEGTISNVSTSGSVSVTAASALGNPTVGGLVGSNQASILLSSSTAQVSGTSNGDAIFVGGLVGTNQASIDRSFATGAVTSTATTSIAAFVGGLAGTNQNGGTITNSYAVGPVSATQSGAEIGGLVGQNAFTGDTGTISAAFSTGAVSGVAGDTLGGLIGLQHDSAHTSNAYWDTISSGTGTGVGSGSSSGVTGLTTAQLSAALPAGFSASVWTNLSNQVTPFIATNPGPVFAGSDTFLSTLVFTPTQLQNINNTLSGNYVLAQDVDMTGFTGFTPIGNTTTAFSGTFNGLGNVVSNLTINDTTDANVGLFGVSSGSISNVGAVGASITGSATSATVGGLVGRNNGSITNAYANATVTGPLRGSSGIVGGLVGAMGAGTVSNTYATGTVNAGAGGFGGGLIGSSSGSVTNSYAIVAVTGGNVSGGLVGAAGGTITNAYAAGSVTGGASGTGGFIGINSATITNGYWDIDRSGTSTGIEFNGGTGTPTGLSGTQPFTKGSYTGFNFTTTPGATGNNWVLVDTDGSINNNNNGNVKPGATMPMLAFEAQSTIQNAHQLQLIEMNPAGSYTLGRNIDATATGSSTSSSTGTDVWGPSGFVPLNGTTGTTTTGFTGTFSGLNATTGTYSTISNLTINSAQSGGGLFGVVGTGGTVGNVVLNNVAVSDTVNFGKVGGLAGNNIGTIFNTGTTGTVSNGSEGFDGGLVGVNNGTISTSFSSAAIINCNGCIAGGLVGTNNTTITDSYTTGSELVGLNQGSVTNAYALGATAPFPGLIGTNTGGGTITNGYYDAGTTGAALGTQSDGSQGLTTSALQAGLPTGFSATKWGIVAGKTYPYLCWQFGGCGETPQVISGTVYQDLTGTSAAGSGIAVTAFVNGSQVNSVLTGGTVTTGANGYYYDLFAPNTIPPFRSVLTFAQNYSIGGGLTASGATLSPANGASATGVNILANTLYAITNETAYSAVVSDLDTADGLTGTTAANVVNGLGNLRIDASGAFTVDGSINTGTLTVNAGGAIGQTAAGTITATTLTGSSGGNAVLNNANNFFQNLAAFATTTGGANGNFTLVDNAAAGNALNIIGAINAGSGTVSLTNVASGGALAASITEQTGGSIAAAALTGSASGNAVFTQPGNQIANLGPFTEPDSANFALTDAELLTVSGVVNAGSGAISLTTTGAGSNLVLDANLNTTGNTVSLVSAGTITKTAIDGIIAATLTGSAGGTANLIGLNAISTLGSFTVSGGDFVLAEGGLTGTVTVSGPVRATNITIGSGEGVINVTGTVAATATAEVGGVTTVGVGSGGNITGGAVVLFTNTGVTLTGTAAVGSAGGVVDFGAPDGVTQAATSVITTGTLQTNGTSLGATSLLGTGNAIANLGFLSMVANASFALIDSQALTVIGPVGSGSNNLSLMTTSGGLTLNGILNAGSANTVTLASAGTIAESSSGATITAGTLTGSSVGGASLTQSNLVGTLSAFSNTGSGLLSLTDAQSLTTSGTNSSAGNLTLTTTGAGSNLRLNGNLTASGNTVTLVSAGTVTQPSGFITANTLTGSSVGGASMLNGNSVANFGAWSDTGAGSTGLKFTDGLTVTTAGTISSTGPITLSAITEPDLILNTNINSGGLLTLFANGNINQTGGGIIAPGLVATTGLTAGGSITLNSATNAITGNATLTSLNTAGTALAGGAISLTDGSSLTIASLGGLQTGVATAGAASVVDGGSLTIAAGATVTGGGVALAAAGNFVNNEGADAVTATGGNRWLIYSNAPAGDTFGNLNSGNTAIWGATFASLPPGSVTAAGNRYIFAQGQTLTVTTTNLSKTYGQDATAAVAAAFTESGFAAGVTNAFLADSAANVVTGTPSVTSTGAAVGAAVAGGPYPIVATAGSLTLASGYSVAFANTGQLTVTPATLTAGLIGTVSKVYDSTTAATLAAANYTLTGILNNDAVSLNDPTTGTYGSANVGTGLNVSVSGLALTGAAAGNYTLASTSANANIGTITPALLTAAIAGNPTKVYDGTTVAALASGNFTVSGFVAGQGATLAAPTNGSYAPANAGTGIGVSASLVAGDFTANAGTLLSNYTLPATASGTGTITPAALTAAIAGNPTKVYDGTTAAALASGNFTLSGFVAGQGATVSASGAYATANAGTGIGVSASLAAGDFTANAGTLLSNYTLPATASGTGTITPALLTAAIAGNPTKVYDGTTVAALASGNFTVSGFVAGQGATLAAPTSGSYATANAGTGIGVSASLAAGDFTANAGTLLSNYALPATASGTGTITPAALTAAIAGNPTKVYDGTTVAALASGNFTVSGFVAGQGATLAAPTSGSYATANAGTGIGVSTNLVAGEFTANAGTLLSNYTLPTTASGTGTITPRPITVTADDLTRPFDQPNPPLTFMLTAGNLVNGDALSGGLATAALVNSPAAAYAITQGTLAATLNYNLTFIGGTLVVTPVAPVIEPLVDFGASPNKYIPPASTAETSPSSVTACSAADLAAVFERTGNVVIFGPQPWICGGGRNM